MGENQSKCEHNLGSCIISNTSQLTTKCQWKELRVAQEVIRASVPLRFLLHFDVFCDLLMADVRQEGVYFFV